MQTIYRTETIRSSQPTIRDLCLGISCITHTKWRVPHTNPNKKRSRLQKAGQLTPARSAYGLLLGLLRSRCFLRRSSSGFLARNRSTWHSVLSTISVGRLKDLSTLRSAIASSHKNSQRNTTLDTSPRRDVTLGYSQHHLLIATAILRSCLLGYSPRYCSSD